MSAHDPDRPPQRGPSLLWGIALAGLVVSLIVKVFTPFKLFLLFLPLGFAPIWFRNRRDRDDDHR